jgi:hypothetical protein
MCSEVHFLGNVKKSARILFCDEQQCSGDARGCTTSLLPFLDGTNRDSKSGGEPRFAEPWHRSDSRISLGKVGLPAVFALRLTCRTPAACRSFAQAILPNKWLAMSEPLARRRRAKGESNGAPSMIRTCDLLVRSQMLYPAELWARQLMILAHQIRHTETRKHRSAEAQKTFCFV